MSGIEEIRQLRHKLHPQTGFMIFFPGLCLISVFLLLAFSHAPGQWSGMEGIAATVGIGVVSLSFVLWSDHGHLVAWDDDAVYVRRVGGKLFFRRHSFVAIPYSDIRGFNFLPPARGAPPKYPLLELDVPSHMHGPPLLIDPNYFTASSLATFVNVLSERRPGMLQGKRGKAVAGLLKRLEA